MRALMLELQASTLTRPHCKYNDDFMAGAFSKNGHFCDVKQVVGLLSRSSNLDADCRGRHPLLRRLASSARRDGLQRVPSIHFAYPTICLTEGSHARALCSMLPPLTTALPKKCIAASLFLSCRLHQSSTLAADGTIVLFLNTSSPRMIAHATG